MEVIEIADDEDADEVADERKSASVDNKTGTTDTSETKKKKRGSSSRAEAGSESNKRSKTGHNLPREIVVEGCGVPEVNGVYKKSFLLPSYEREGMWKGSRTNFYITYVHSELQIYSTGHDFYCGKGDRKSLTTSWHRMKNGKLLPAPKIVYEED